MLGILSVHQYRFSLCVALAVWFLPSASLSQTVISVVEGVVAQRLVLVSGYRCVCVCVCV